MTETPHKFVPVIFTGYVSIETSMLPDGPHRMVWVGRKRTYDGNDNLLEDTGWQPTGIVLTWPQPKPRPWWKFWG